MIDLSRNNARTIRRDHQTCPHCGASAGVVWGQGAYYLACSECPWHARVNIWQGNEPKPFSKSTVSKCPVIVQPPSGCTG